VLPVAATGLLPAPALADPAARQGACAMNSNGGRGYSLRALRIGIDTHEESVLYLRSDCPVCHTEGFSASARLTVRHGDHALVATLNVVDTALLPEGC